MTLLNGLRVVELSRSIAGLYCTKLMADAGAAVLAVGPEEPLVPVEPIGEGLREFLDVSKRRVSGGLDTFLGSADVLVSSEPVDVPSLRERYPSLVIVTISPFGWSGPWADRPATEFTLQACCGSMATRGVPEEPPLSVGGRLGEYFTGAYAATGAMGAVIGARRTGRGEHVDVAMLDAMTAGMTLQTYLVAPFLETNSALSAPGRMAEIPSIEPAADGYVIFTANTAEQFQNLSLLIGHQELMEDTELVSHQARFARRAELEALIRKFTTQHTTDELLAKAESLRVPAGPVGNGATVTGFGHFAERGVYLPAPSGRCSYPRVPYAISGTAPRPFGSRPERDEFVDGRRDRDRRPPHTSPAPGRVSGRLPLEGVRVVDCTAWWAGPAMTSMLAALGADVIKIESPKRPDMVRYITSTPPSNSRWYETSPLFHALNHTKRDLTLDLSTASGAAALSKLVETADVFVENFSPRVMEQLGFDCEALHRINPGLVAVRMPAFGLDGPWRDRTGFAQTMEAVSGIAWMTGWANGQPAIARGPCDPLAAVHAAFAALVTLCDRFESGRGRCIESTMVEAALNVTAEQVIEYQTGGVLQQRRGNRNPFAAPQGVYPCANEDEWVAVAVTSDEQWEAFAAVLGNPELAASQKLKSAEGRHAEHDDLDVRISELTVDHDPQELVDLLTAAGVPAAAVVQPRAVHDNPQLLYRGFFESVEHEIVGGYRVPRPPFRYSGVQRWVRSPAPTLGQHNTELLDEIGIGAAEQEQLRADRVIGRTLYSPNTRSK